MFMQLACVIVSLVLVAFGQPAWNPYLGLCASAGAYTLFWSVLIKIDQIKWRFCLATAWFTVAHLVQLSWMTAHELVGEGILVAYVFFSFATGVQFALLSLLIRPSALKHRLAIFALPAIWTLMEWSRQFFMSGYMWNPVGLGLAGSQYSMQLATLIGAFGLSYWVILSNVVLLKACVEKSYYQLGGWGILILFPYLFGWGHIYYHSGQKEGAPQVEALLVQTNQMPTSELGLRGVELAQHAFEQWCYILSSIDEENASNQEKAPDIIALPESALPFMAYQAVYPLKAVRSAIRDIAGDRALGGLPEDDPNLVHTYDYEGQQVSVVSNAFWAQAIANIYQADVIAGLQDVDESSESLEVYQAALHFQPTLRQRSRYAKRVLVPIGEYIVDDPFGWCKKVAALYGLQDSFTAGKQAAVFYGKKERAIGVSICYEEIFGDLMRESRKKGADLFVNLTNDGWYPRSRLPQQHFHHARLRSVECGVPLLRACTTGVTAAVDSLGSTVASLGAGVEPSSDQSQILRVSLSSYHYPTLYAHLGDGLIIGLSFIFTLLAFRYRSF